MKLSNEDLQTNAAILNALINYENTFDVGDDVVKAIDKLALQLAKEVNGLSI